MIEPLRLSFEVACSQRHAFEVWTRRIDLWWPADHTATGEEGLRITLEPRIGGRIFQRDPAGVEIDWGEVTEFGPPEVLGYRWHLRRDKADATDVRIRFVPMDPARTRVDIEHQGWERLGADGPVWRDRNHQGWTTLLPHYLRAVAATTNA
ncbi:MAG TPA: SRPBCC domain-containing protein [Actinophytocola sp.]|nr:SRPBCC domain-containing protein [Actinophytocola sp.]